MLSYKPWRLEYLLIFGGALIMGMCTTILLAELLHKAAVTGFKTDDDFGFLVCGTLGIQGVIWLLIPIFLKFHHVGFREAFGLNNSGWPKSLLLAAGLLLCAIPFILALQNVCVALLTKLGHPPANQKAVDMFLDATTPWTRAYFIFFAVILAPVAEEFVFRGVLYPYFKQAGWPRASFVGVSALFALIHFDVATFIPLCALAMFLTWLYERTNCLLASITAHSLFNFTNVLLLYFSPQIQDFLQRSLHIPAQP